MAGNKLISNKRVTAKGRSNGIVLNNRINFLLSFFKPASVHAKAYSVRAQQKAFVSLPLVCTS